MKRAKRFGHIQLLKLERSLKKGSAPESLTHKDDGMSDVFLLKIFPPPSPIYLQLPGLCISVWAKRFGHIQLLKLERSLKKGSAPESLSN